MAVTAPTPVGVGPAIAGIGQITVSWPAHVLGDIALLDVESANEVVATPPGWAAVPNSPQGTGTTAFLTVAHVATVLHNETNPTSSCTVTIPGGAVAGTDLFLFLTSRNHTAATVYPSITDTDVGGNTWLYLAGSGDRKASIWWKKATAGTASKKVTVQGSVNSVAAVLSCYSGCAPIPYTDFTLESHAVGDQTHTAFTPSFANEMIGLAVFNYSINNSVTAEACTTPGALTHRGEAFSAGGSHCQVTHASAKQSGGPTTTGGFAWTQGGALTYSITFGLRPAAAGSTRLTRFWRRATQSNMPAPVITGPNDHIFGVIHTYRGCAASGNPYDVGSGDVATSPATAVTFPAATTTVDGCLIVLGIARELTTGYVSGWTNASLASLTERVDLNTNYGKGGGIAIATGIRAVAGNYGATTALQYGATVQGRITTALKPLGAITLPVNTFLSIHDPIDPTINQILNVVVGSFHEDPVAWKGTDRQAFDGTYLSSRRRPKRRFRCTAEFMSPGDVESFRYFIDAAPDSFQGTFVGARPMYMMGDRGAAYMQTALRGAAYLLVMIDMGLMTPLEYEGGGMRQNTWTVDLVFKEV